MANENEVFSAIGVYNGHSAKGSFDIDLKLLFTEPNLKDAIQFIAGIGKEIKVVAVNEIEGLKVKLGTWTVHRVAVDKNAQTAVVLKSTMDRVYSDNIPDIMLEDTEFVFKVAII